MNEHTDTQARAADAPAVSILVVSYNTRELTVECLKSVYNGGVGSAPFEVLLVDNASCDGSVEAIRDAFSRLMFPSLRIFALEENIGFAAANNFAAGYARGTYLLLLNPDTLVRPGAIDRLLEYADFNPENGIYGGETFFADGSRNPTAGWMKPTPWSVFTHSVGLSRLFGGSAFLNPESLAHWSWDAAKPVDIVTGCLLLIRLGDWNRLGGFDTSFFMYGEDADLCLRAAARGMQPVLVPGAAIVHYGGASEPVRSEKMIRLYRAKVQLFRLHYPAPSAALMTAMLGLSCLVRMAAFAIAGMGNRRCEWRRQVPGAGLVGTRRASDLQRRGNEWRSVWSRRAEWMNQPIKQEIAK